jgi:hypothetical protein
MNFAVNTVSKVTAKIKDVMWIFSRDLDMLGILFVMVIILHNVITFSNFVGLHSNFDRNKFRAITAFTCLSLPSRIASEEGHPAV